MTSSNAAISFLSRMGFSHSQASLLKHQFNDDMSRLMICSNRDLIGFGLSLDARLRLLRAIRCFHMEKWSKYLMNNFSSDTSTGLLFEQLIYHLVKFHSTIIFASWSMNYIRKFIFMKDIEDIQIFYNKLRRTQEAIERLKQTVQTIKKQLS